MHCCGIWSNRKMLLVLQVATRWQCCTFELDVDGVAVPHQVAAGQQLWCVCSTGTAGPVDFADVVSLHAVGAQAQLATWVHVSDVLLSKTHKVCVYHVFLDRMSSLFWLRGRSDCCVITLKRRRTTPSRTSHLVLPLTPMQPIRKWRSRPSCDKETSTV